MDKTVLTVGDVTVTIERTATPTPQTPPGAFSAGAFDGWSREQLIARVQERESAATAYGHQVGELREVIRRATPGCPMAQSHEEALRSATSLLGGTRDLLSAVQQIAQTGPLTASEAVDAVLTLEHRLSKNTRSEMVVAIQNARRTR